MTRILLVEDDEHQRLLYREQFEEAGYCVVEARDGREALDSIERQPPDAVVLDINMPGMDGIHTLTRIHDRYRRLPVVLNSAYAGYRERFVSWLADAYVIKSSDAGELTRTVRSVLAQRAG
jgi:CheY-like chemotaxis protein